MLRYDAVELSDEEHKVVKDADCFLDDLLHFPDGQGGLGLPEPLLKLGLEILPVAGRVEAEEV